MLNGLGGMFSKTKKRLWVLLHSFQHVSQASPPEAFNAEACGPEPYFLLAIFQGQGSLLRV